MVAVRPPARGRTTGAGERDRATGPGERDRATGPGERGMVTAETAVVLPVLLLVLAAAVAAVVLVGAQLRCVDAAREGARAAARGESAATVADLVGRAGPDGATVSTGTAGDRVTVTVSARVQPLGPLPLALTVSAAATALVEPGAG